MIDQSRLDKGLYWQQAWKLVEGCTKVSPGCDNCWSEAETVMRACHPNEKISHRAHNVLGGMLADHFDGSITCRIDNLDLPLRTKKPTVFAIWNDFFHEDVPTDFIDRAYAVMALCPHHTFLVLTKRSDRLAQYWGEERTEFGMRIWKASPHVKGGRRVPATECGLFQEDGIKNVWHGVTVENQEQADQRIPHLLKIPGKRFVSIEPMIGRVDLNVSMRKTKSVCDWCGGFVDSSHDCYEPGVGIDAILLGGESGKNARPMHRGWVYSVRDQCESAGVPFFFKQWGEWVNKAEIEEWDRKKAKCVFASYDGINQDPMEIVRRVGKKKAGRTLDGKLHDDLPWLSA